MLVKVSDSWYLEIYTMVEVAVVGVKEIKVLLSQPLSPCHHVIGLLRCGLRGVLGPHGEVVCAGHHVERFVSLAGIWLFGQRV